MKKDSKERLDRLDHFEKWLDAQMLANPLGIDLNLIINKGARIVGVNYHTARRYLDSLMAMDERKYRITTHCGKKVLRATTDKMLEAEAKSVLTDYTQPRYCLPGSPEYAEFTKRLHAGFEKTPPPK